MEYIVSFRFIIVEYGMVYFRYDGNSNKLLSYRNKQGVIITPLRLKTIGKYLNKIKKEYKPNKIIIEKVFIILQINRASFSCSRNN